MLLLSLRCLPGYFPRCGFPDVVSQLPQGFLGCCLVVFPLFWRGWFPQMSSNCLPQFPFVSQNWFGDNWQTNCLQASSICRPVVSQSSFKMLFPTCRLVVSRLSCKYGLPIISVLFQTCPPDSFPVVFHSTPTPHSCLLPIL